jgi:hypothetical protein
MSLMEPDALSTGINKLPKWARDYIHQVETFCGAEEVEELIQLRDQRRQLIKLIAELKAENRCCGRGLVAGFNGGVACEGLKSQAQMVIRIGGRFGLEVLPPSVVDRC